MALPMLACCLSLAFGCSPGGASSDPCEVQKLSHEGGSPNSRFGFSVALRGDRMLVGAPHGGGSGEALLWERQSTGWELSAVLSSSDGENSDQFGTSVAVDGDTALVGAIANGPLGAKGAAYVFERTPSGWVETEKLVASNPDAWAFGRSVALEGDRAVVGASGASLGSGKGYAFVFERGPSGWAETATLVSGLGTGDGFGWSVALLGDRIAVGAPSAFDAGYRNLGGAFVFELQPGDVWGQTASLAASDSVTDDWFGRSVALEGDTLLVGAPLNDEVGGNAGAAYVFDLVLGAWTETAKLVPDPPAGVPGSQNFGWAVDLEGQQAAVGVSWDDAIGPYAGAAHLYLHEASGWTEVAKLFGSAVEAESTFGYAVAMDGTEILVGAPSAGGLLPVDGAAYLFTTLQPCLSAPQPGTAGVPNTLGLQGATPGALVGAGFSLAPGTTALGPLCPGLSVGLASPLLVGLATADASGGASFGGVVPPALSGKTAYLQGADLGACAATNLLAYTFP